MMPVIYNCLKKLSVEGERLRTIANSRHWKRSSRVELMNRAFWSGIEYISHVMNAWDALAGRSQSFYSRTILAYNATNHAVPPLLT